MPSGEEAQSGVVALHRHDRSGEHHGTGDRRGPTASRTRRRHLTEATAPSAPVEVDGRSVLELTPADGVISVALVMPGIERRVDVTASPATATRALLDAGAHAGEPPSRTLARARDALTGAATLAGIADVEGLRALAATLSRRSTRPRSASVEHHEGISLFAAAAFPLVADAMRAGAGPIGDIPRWALVTLRAPDARTAAERTFGPEVTRRVVAALAASFVLDPDPGATGTSAVPMDLTRLCVALMAHDVLVADHLAALLAHPTAARSVDTLPDRRGIDTVVHMVRHWPASTVVTMFSEVLDTPNGLDRLSVVARHWFDLGDAAPRNPPRRLGDLEDACLQRLPASTRIVSAPRTDRQRPRPAPRLAATPRPVAPPPTDDIPRTAPFVPTSTQRAARTARTPLRVRRDVAALEGRTCGRYIVTIPRTPGDLTRWGRFMSNCLGTYVAAAQTGESTLIGFVEGSQLRLVAEISSRKRLRQLLGPANRRPDDADRTQIIAFLTAEGILRPV